MRLRPRAREGCSRRPRRALIDRFATAVDAVSTTSPPWIETETTNAAGIAALQNNFTGNCPGSGPICTGPTRPAESRTPMFDQGHHGHGGSSPSPTPARRRTPPGSPRSTGVTVRTGSRSPRTRRLCRRPLGTLHPDNEDHRLLDPARRPGVTASPPATVPAPRARSSATPPARSGTASCVPSAYLPEPRLLADGWRAACPVIRFCRTRARPARRRSSSGLRRHAAYCGPTVPARAQQQLGCRPAAGIPATTEPRPRDLRQPEGLLVVVSARQRRRGRDVPARRAMPGNALTVAALGHGGNLARPAIPMPARPATAA